MTIGREVLILSIYAEAPNQTIRDQRLVFPLNSSLTLVAIFPKVQMVDKPEATLVAKWLFFKNLITAFLTLKLHSLLSFSTHKSPVTRWILLPSFDNSSTDLTWIKPKSSVFVMKFFSSHRGVGRWVERGPSPPSAKVFFSVVGAGFKPGCSNDKEICYLSECFAGLPTVILSEFS